jgi:HK97 gp10 family phage protein
VAASKQIFKVEGLKELDDAMVEFSDEWGPRKVKPLLTRVLKKEGQPIRDAGEQLAPVDQGGLKASYSIGTKLSRRQKKLNRKESDVEVYVGPGPAAKSTQTEFGNAHQAAQPHLRPAWDGNVMKVLGGIKDRLTEEIAKTIARFEAKAAREAAKLKAGN